MRRHVSGRRNVARSAVNGMKNGVKHGMIASATGAKLNASIGRSVATTDAIDVRIIGIGANPGPMTGIVTSLVIAATSRIDTIATGNTIVLTA